MLVLLVGPVTAKQNPEISYRNLPSWVLDASIPDTNKKRMRAVDEGIYHLIDDTQIKIGKAGSDYYLRTAKKVISRSGLEDASQIQLNYDPDLDSLVLHRAAVWRDGKMIDQTSTAMVEVMRRESELEEGVITGQRTANLRLDDVRVGDVTDIAWSLNEKKSYWPGHFFGEYTLGWSVPVALTRLRVIVSSSVKLNKKLTNGAPDHTETSLGGSKVLTWTVKDPLPIVTENKTPKWLKKTPSVELSTMPNWSEVVRWARPFYDVSQTLPLDLQAKVDAIAANSKDPKTRMSKALWLVQDSVRYTSLSVGIGGYRPRAPSTTWKSGFGDCKDKTTLLIAVLRRLGIAATPALTDTESGNGLNLIQPRADAFNHVIVRVSGFDKPIWLDPTGSHEGGIFPNIAVQTYGYALPLTVGQSKLEKINAPAPKEPTIEVVESHVRSNKGVKINIQATYKRDEANIKRSNIADSSINAIEKSELEYYAGTYSGAEQVGKMIVEDDRDQNILVVRQNYFLPATADDYEDTIVAFQINAWSFNNLFDTPDVGERQTEFRLPHQINRRHITKLKTPGTTPGLPDDETISGDAFEFNRTSVRDGDMAIIEMNLVGKTTILEASEVAAYRADVEKLTDLSYEYIDLDDEFGFVDSDFFLLVVALAWIGGLVLLIWAIQALKAAELAGTVVGLYRPIGILKFLILSLCTFNMYIFYWFWRCWRRHQQIENVDISPFWRAFFGVFWTFELFKSARSDAILKAPIWIQNLWR